MPLFFQVVLGDTPSTAGLRLAIPSIGTPIGGLIAGFVMSRWGQLAALVRVGTCLMALGNFLIMSLRLNDASWKHFIYLLSANLGQGITYPSILFTFIAAFEQKGKSRWYELVVERIGSSYKGHRTSCVDIYNLPYPFARHRLRRCVDISNRPKLLSNKASEGFAWGAA